MSEHLPILPWEAIEILEAAGVQNPKVILADYAAAGIIKTYALVRETASVGLAVETVRDASIPRDVWQRIVAENKACDALNGGTVRVQGSYLGGGAPSIQITGVSFLEASLAKILKRYSRTLKQTSVSKLEPTPSLSAINDSASVSNGCKGKRIVPTIKPGDLLASIAQTMQVTGLRRGKVGGLLKQGILVKKEVGRRTLVTVESIERFCDVESAVGSRAR